MDGDGDFMVNLFATHNYDECEMTPEIVPVQTSVKHLQNNITNKGKKKWYSMLSIL